MSRINGQGDHHFLVPGSPFPVTLLHHSRHLQNLAARSVTTRIRTPGGKDETTDLTLEGRQPDASDMMTQEALDHRIHLVRYLQLVEVAGTDGPAIHHGR